MSYGLVYYGNKTLASTAEKVKNIDDKIINIIDNMFEIMYKEKGIGLAAPQINLNKRIIVVDINDENKNKIALINPEIVFFSDTLIPYEEGCLSLPGLNADVVRPTSIVVKGISPAGKTLEYEASGLFARVIQHEIDHLDGVLFIDRIEKYLKNELRSELKKIKKLNEKY
jgi:peptide deformylase